MEASVTPSPEPPYSSGIRRGQVARLGQGPNEIIGVCKRRVELAPIGVREAATEITDSLSEIVMKLWRRDGHVFLRNGALRVVGHRVDSRLYQTIH